jgi:hypothetical protein
MIKRIALALALTASLGGAVLACNTPASTTTPTTVAPSTTVTTPSTAPASDMMSTEPSAS